MAREDRKDKLLLEAPDLDPVVAFDPATVLLLMAIAVIPAMVVYVRFGALMAVLSFGVIFYWLYRTSRRLATRFPPGYLQDRLFWLTTREEYFPGKPKAYPPLVVEEKEE